MGASDPSPMVRLEVAFLADDEAVAAPAPPAAPDGGPCLTVLVVAAETDFRRYVRECLRERTDLRVLEAATVAAAVTLRGESGADLLIVDDPDRDVLTALSELRAVVIVDDVPRAGAAPGARRRLLARPFTALGLVAEVGRLLGEAHG